jgi:hypothetical protein
MAPVRGSIDAIMLVKYVMHSHHRLTNDALHKLCSEA